MTFPAILCATCANALDASASTCASCGDPIARWSAVIGLRHAIELETPDPIEAAPLERALDQLDAGVDFKRALETLLLELDDAQADRLMLLLREGRGAWHPALNASGGAALLVGNAFTGTSVPLAAAGFRVTVVDRCASRARFGAHRDLALAPGATRSVVLPRGARLPFHDRTFELVVVEGGLPPRASLDECRRVCGGELVLIADNRLGYKRSAGRRGHFRVPGPIDYLRGVAAPRRGERTLLGYRAALRASGLGVSRAFALYPHSREFSHVVGIDQPLPALTIGPKERRNRLKMLAMSAGLFPVLTPSFAVIARSTEPQDPRPRVRRILERISQRVGEPAGDVEQWIATRGNTAVLLTGSTNGEPRGRWCIHVPLSPQQREQIIRHHAMTARLRAEFPLVPTPEPLLIGEVEGVFLACERRLDGLTAPQLTGDHRAAAKLFADAAAQLATLVARPAQPLTPGDFERLIGARCDLVARYCAVATTAANIQRLRDRLAERLIGLSIPLVIHHADLRSKHVQVREDGSVLGYLDWGSSEACDLPYFDLLHLIAHERKQESDLTARRAWQIVADRGELREHERRALEDHARALELDDAFCRGLEQLYPVLVGAMAEKNWDYSRPRWVHRQFGL